MYRKDSEGWLKHADFMVLDMICLQLAFILAYALRGKGMNLYGDILYRNMAIFLGLADLVVIFTAGFAQWQVAFTAALNTELAAVFTLLTALIL